MDNIIELNQRRREPPMRPPREGSATIVFFPGVRYEREQPAADGARRPYPGNGLPDRRSK